MGKTSPKKITTKKGELQGRWPCVFGDGERQLQGEMIPASSLNLQACAAATNPSHPLIGVTFRCSAACFGCPHSSSIDSSAFLLERIDTRTWLYDVRQSDYKVRTARYELPAWDLLFLSV
jgi:hypothetical protein